MINSVVIVGRLTKDPVLKKTQNGKSTVAFTLACNRDKDTAEFIACRAYSVQAEVLSRHTRKGSQIGITGSIHAYTTDRNGVKEYHQEILVNSITFLDSKQTEEPQEEPTLDVDPDDLPF